MGYPVEKCREKLDRLAGLTGILEASPDLFDLFAPRGVLRGGREGALGETCSFARIVLERDACESQQRVGLLLEC